MKVCFNESMKKETQKVHIDKMSPRQLEYAFIKVAGLLLDQETAFIKMPTHLYSVFSLARLNLSNNLTMLKYILDLKNIYIDVAKQNSIYNAAYKNKNAIGSNEATALIKCFLVYHTDGYVEIPISLK